MWPYASTTPWWCKMWFAEMRSRRAFLRVWSLLAEVEDAMVGDEIVRVRIPGDGEIALKFSFLQNDYTLTYSSRFLSGAVHSLCSLFVRLC